MLIKISVKTPKDQATKCIKTQKKALLSYEQRNKVIEEKVVSHKLFYWIIEVKDQKELTQVIKKAAAGEVLIKQFYSGLFKLISRANKLAGKFSKGYKWIKKYLLRTINKKYKGNSGMIEHITNMSDEELKDFLVINDKEEMAKLLSGELIKIEEIK